MRKLSCEPGIEVIGASMLSIIDNAQAEEIHPLLLKHDLTNIEPQAWYAANRWLEVMNEMSAGFNASSNFVAIGMMIAQNVVLPSNMENATLPQILTMWDKIYQMQHRGGDAGNKQVEKLSENQYRVTLRDLYPDDLSYGVAYGFCRRFLPEDKDFTIKYEDLSKRRDTGTHTETVLIIEWH